MKQINTLTSISVSGFKSIGTKQSLSIKPLTVLAGANSSGKTSIMQALLLLKQTLESQTEPEGALLLSGPNARFSSARDILHRKEGADISSVFTIELGSATQEKLNLSFKEQENGSFEVDEMFFQSRDKGALLRHGMTKEEILTISPELSPIFTLFKEATTSPIEYIVIANRCFLDVSVIVNHAVSDSSHVGVEANLGNTFIPKITEIIHLPGLRGNPERAYKKTSWGPKYPGTFEQYTASILAQWKKDKDNRLTDLGRMLELMGLTWKVDVRPITDAQHELVVARLPHAQRSGAYDLINITDVGFGVSQTLPVLVALATAKPGQMVYLEQPEIHLHPRAQLKLARVIHEASQHDVVIVVETHSSIFLREIQTLIASGVLPKQDVALHWFERNEDGETEITLAEIDENGAFGDWPADFDVVDLQSETDYLDAVEKRKAFLIERSL